MIVTLFPLVSLFASCFILMLGFGLIGILLPVRMGIENISTDTIGLVLSMYAVGMLLGGYYCRRLIDRVGHIRIFAASAAMSAMAILLCSLYVNEWLWGIMRMVMGFSIACAFAVIDGWLSDAASEQTRGRILATSQIVVMAALFCGQFLLNIAPPEGTKLFVIAGILLCFALLPLILSKRVGPTIHEMTGMSYRDLIKASPLGVTACFFSGLLYGAIINMLPVFAKHYDIVGFNLSLYVAAAVFGAFILQFPVGVLSDRFDRRSVLFYLLVISIATTLATPFGAHNSLFYLMLVTTGISTGIFTCLYPMSIAETFDRIQRSEMASAMGGLLMIYALGSIFGPLASSYTMQKLGDDALFSFLAVAQGLLLIFVVYRMKARAALPVEEQESFVIQQPSVATALYELDPRTQYEILDLPISLEAQVAITIAESSPAAAVNMAKEIAQTSPEKAASLTAALAQVDDIDVARLFSSIIKAAPELSLEIAEALASNAPEQSTELVAWLAENQPDKLAEMVAEIAEEFPAPVIEEPEEIRPAEVEAYHESATELVTHFAENQPEQAVNIAAAVVENLPDMASEMVEILNDAEQVPDKLVSDINDRPDEAQLEEPTKQPKDL
ncbi:MFS transporter [Neptunomonas marina]|uniref:MFS transporter n=1 Tax=Neptunomonas marina TaxID=1815562 RepID=A0A437Q6J3_9GAMM|nr:MFS transporter [Neptunomonas marina]RVU30107.1 MFS transporter [Neptunomonas marina]